MSPATDIQARVVDPTGQQDWNREILARYPEAGPFHTAEWARVLTSSYGYDAQYVRLDATAQSHLMLPLMEVRSWLTGTRGVSLPFTDECTALARGESLQAVAFRKLIELAEQRHWRYVELRGNGLVPKDIAPSVSFHGHKLLLGRDPATLFAKFYGAVRTSVRKAEQHKLTVEFSRNPEATDAFYKLLCLTRSRHGAPPQPRHFFAQIQRQMLESDLGTVALARAGTSVVAGAIFFHFGRTAIYKYAASDVRFRDLQGNNFVLWKAIERYLQQGYEVLDFGRTSLTNEGLRRFKLGWNTQETTTRYFRYDCSTRRFVGATDQSTEGASKKVFQTLPLGLSRLIGTALYKHIG